MSDVDKTSYKMVMVKGQRRRVTEADFPLEDVIARGAELQSQIDELMEKLRSVKEEALRLAQDHIKNRRTVTLTGLAGALEVRLNGPEITADVDQAGELRKQLGDRFSAFFDEKVEYRISRKGREVVNESSAPEANVIRALARTRDVPPTIRFRYQ